jgi:arylsulfatase A-like enzyme
MIRLPIVRRALWGALALLLLVVAAPVAAGGDPAPNLVFLLLDTTRADRMSAWGNPRRTTPNLDALARGGIRFARHFANSHATRPSMPQLMSGRYYEPSILREFRPRTHPRDWPFVTADPSLALLPEILEAAGYRLLAVSAHPWVAHASRFGAPFDVFEEPTVEARRGHPDADVIVNRALALWRARSKDRPTFLYLHFMDAHIPRYVPPGQLRFGVDDPAERRRFDDAGEPTFGDPWHTWDRSDARAFTPDDVAFFAAVYDTLLASLDEQIGRLVAAIRTDDPGLRRTLIVVTADHGEELGEHGRISHEASLDDAVQHVPWIVAGRGIVPGQVAWGVTEHVDVLPTLLEVLGVDAPPGVSFDGHAVIRDGRVCETCLRSYPVFAWEDYRGVRLGRELLREERADSFSGRCAGSPRLLDRRRRKTLSDPTASSVGVRLISRNLDAPQSQWDSTRFAAPADRPFSVLPAFWRLDGDVPVACAVAGPDTPRAAFAVDGWIWTGRGVIVLSGAGQTRALPLRLDVPDGKYDVDLGVRDVSSPPRFFGFTRWLRNGVRRREPAQYLPVGRATAVGGRVHLEIPAALAAQHHVVSIRLRPVGLGAGAPRDATGDTPLRERLRSLGYVR